MVLIRFSALLPSAILLWAGAAAAANLAKVNRTIKREPVYQSKPKYCLLVFGPEARHRVWLVLDGDTLYVDRNGNGDLTEDGKCIRAPAFRPSTYPVHARERLIEAGDVSVGGLTHTGLVVSQAEYRRTVLLSRDTGAWTPQEWQEHVDSVWGQVPDGVVSELSINLDPKCYGLFGDAQGRRIKHVAFVDWHGRLVFVDRPQDAPVVHFGGPLTLYVRPGEKLRRGEDPEEMGFWLGSLGLGPGTFALMGHDLVPRDVHPVVEVRFPAKEPGQKLVTRKYVLQRC